MHQLCNVFRMIALILCICCPSESMAWEDPFNSDTQLFDDPWNKDTNKKTFDDPWDKKTEKDVDNKIQKKNTPEYFDNRHQMETHDPLSDKSIKTDTLLQEPKGSFHIDGQYIPQKEQKRQQIFDNPTSVNDMDDVYSDFVPDYLTPFGINKGDDSVKAYNYLTQNGLVYAGQCNGASYFVLDPQNTCMGILISGQEKVLGATTYISKECVNSNPLYAMYEDFAQKGKSTKTGWEINKNGRDISSCLQNAVAISNNDVPNFLRYIHGNMTPDVVDIVIQELGGTVVQVFNNGKQYDLLGSDVWYEFCPLNEKMISIAINIKKEHPVLRKLIDEMKILRDTIPFASGVITSKRTKGIITSIEYMYTDNDALCKKNI